MFDNLSGQQVAAFEALTRTVLNQIDASGRGDPPAPRRLTV
jgi:hypothetical protein